ncbi:hypothetical protein [Ectopseudomonas composti]|uniref:hypothetical protein n=1 Tax=Ectopseudomonas composti TaxID=658457 RepID=UPI00103892A2|nr:hypothetical protein [Pseudomonas composti]
MEVFISIAISAILVLVETFGIIMAKWFIVRSQAEEASVNAMADAAANYTGQNGIEAHIRDAGRNARLSVQRTMVTDVSPGPELSFLSLTLFTALFLSYHYSSDALRQSITPYLHGSKSDYPILLAAIILSLAFWWVLYWWRELVTSGTQEKLKGLSMVIIAALGTANLTGAIFLFVAGRS